MLDDAPIIPPVDDDDGPPVDEDAPTDAQIAHGAGRRDHGTSFIEDGAPQDYQPQHTKSATITASPATTATIDNDGNDQDETANASKAIVPPSLATDTTDDSSDSEDDDADESGDEESNDYTCTNTNKHS